MTELAVREAHVPELYDDPTGGRLVAWAQAAHAANQIAVALCRTAFAPAHFRDNPGDTTAAILAGDELGLSPLAAMRSIYVIKGTPALYARTMVALVQSRGHEVWTDKSTDDAVTVCGRRRGSERTEQATWTMARAQRAGYTSNGKYKSNGQEMLYAKAAAEVCRKIAADVLLGVPATVEDIELEDAQPEPPRKVQRRQVKADVPEPALEPEPEPDPTPEPTDSITEPQMKKLHALLRDLGLDRDAGLSRISEIVGAEVASTKDLSKSEASVVIDTLEAGDPLDIFAGDPDA